MSPCMKSGALPQMPSMRCSDSTELLQRYHHVEAGFEQGESGMRADIAGPAGHQDFVEHGQSSMS